MRIHFCSTHHQLQMALYLGALSFVFAGCNFARPEPPRPTPTLLPVPTLESTSVALNPEAPLVEGEQPFVPTHTRLTESGCCTQPYWSPDSSMVLFIDGPPGRGETGIYGVPVGGGEVRLITTEIGIPSQDGRYSITLNRDGETVVQATDSDIEYVIPNGGRRVFISPDSSRVAWVEEGSGTFDGRPVIVGAADINGENVRQLLTIFGGGFAGWLDNETLLLSGRRGAEIQQSSLFTYAINTGEQRDLVQGQRMRSTQVAPGGGWILFTIALSPDGNEQAEGMWVISRDGETVYKFDILFGSAQWRDESRLAVIPLDIGARSFQIWQFDAENGQSSPLTNPENLSFRIESGNWAVSPNGQYVVYLSSEDQALWVFDLPPIK